jgi:formate--tetrahydrofolate ligase
MTADLLPIADVAAQLGLQAADLEPYGRHMAKLDPRLLQRPRHSGAPPKLVLVSAMTPTPAGEGKTTTTIGLTQGLRHLGVRAVAALREPSLGPCFGVKGGGTGAGRSQIEPSQRINLHCTGDLHAITAAHNLLAACIDNHLQHGNRLDIDPRRVVWPRVLDVNDRALRHVMVGLGGSAHGVPREASFDITAASEVMAVLGLAHDEADLRARLERMLVAWTRDGRPVLAGQLGVTGALLVLLREALWPNLVQTTEGAPAIVHCGPFANIAHGCNSVLATRLALHLGDVVCTEAGFAFDLGGEKFLDIKARSAGLGVHAVVLVATVRALKLHGGVALGQLATADVEAVRRGLANLDAHLDAVQAFGLRAVVAVNHFVSDDDSECEAILDHCAARGVTAAVSRHFADGGRGAADLARAVLAVAAESDGRYRTLYEPDQPLDQKVEQVARTVYGAASVEWSAQARKDLHRLQQLGYDGLSVCMAKTQSSLSDDPKRLGRPLGHVLHVRELVLSAGAGFVVVLTGELMRMPGLPASPQAERIDVEDGEVRGLG